jgi:hypothetical protein
MANGSVEDQLVEKKKFMGDFESEDWKTIVQMAVDAATGMYVLARELELLLFDPLMVRVYIYRYLTFTL